VNRVSSPVKFAEYCLCGLPVIITDNVGDYSGYVRSYKLGHIVDLNSVNRDEELKDFKDRGNNWVEPLREWISDTKQATFLTNAEDLHEIRAFVEKVGTNPSVRDKTARFGAPALSELVFAYNAKTDFVHAQTPVRKASGWCGVNDVSLCGLIISFARTYYGSRSD